MATYFTISEAAAKLGRDKSVISRHARRLKLGLRAGTSVLLTVDDLAALKAALKAAKPGNPNFVPGNKFGRRPKKAKKSS